MFKQLFGSGRKSHQTIIDAVYEQIVAEARQPVFYAEWNVPDTPLGRYEMLALHVFLFLHRMRGETGAAREIAQGVTDEFFRDLEHSLRELGIGDMGVPRRMKKLAQMFYGRATAYGEGIDRADRAGLAAALKRNVRPDAQEWPEAVQLADYAFAAFGRSSDVPVEAILGGASPFARLEGAAT